MEDSNRTRREDLVIHAVDPWTGKRDFDVWPDVDKLLWIGRQSMGASKTAAYLMPYGLKSPTGVFQGIRFEEDEQRSRDGAPGWLCYASTPDWMYSRDGDEREAPEGMVFLVFVNENRIVYHWCWAKASPDDSRFPEEYETRFREKLL